ncbi:Vacuolar fusion protein MON1 A [Nymphon striatum]|nr:Vacuolar fusion protein MON1 A [Nymphon striatum]KAG1683810.1 Vacuolar fusion protein MON1 A [Nymphon striatum]
MASYETEEILTNVTCNEDKSELNDTHNVKTESDYIVENENIAIDTEVPVVLEEENLNRSDSHSVLLAVDSYEEITGTIESDYEEEVRKYSGTISEIEKISTPEKEKHFVEDVPATSTTVSNDVDFSDRFEDLAIIEERESSEWQEKEELSWQQQEKHVFILSEAGKPIYSRHGNEDRLVTMMGVMQALVSFVLDSKDVIRSISTGENGHVFAFLVRSPVILVAVSRCGESETQLMIQLTYIYSQILSFLSYTRLSSVFEQRRNYDLRRLLTTCDKLIIDNLITLLDSDPGLLLGAVRCLQLSNTVRDTISQSIIQSCSKVKNLVFAILISDRQLVTMVRMKKYSLHPADLHLIINMVDSTESFKSAESWTPICLPKFDSSGFLHGHISYLDENCPACLLLLTVDKDAFFTLASCRQKIVDRLKKYNCFDALNESLANGNYSISEIGVPDLRHVMYKVKSLSQYTSPSISAVPYHIPEESTRLFRRYQYLHHRVHVGSRPLRILLHVGERETLLGWVTSTFELYATFEPLVTKSSAVNAVNKIIKWVKREEDKLFILTAPVF